MTKPWNAVIQDQFRFLIFQFKREDYDSVTWQHLVVGGVFTWLVGIARNWDYASASIPARLGLMSVGYIFGLALVLWFFSRRLDRKNRSYLWVVSAVAMTAPPGLVYGIPVENMGMTAEDAQLWNLRFLGAVAAWRVSLAIHFLWVGTEMKWRSLSVLLTPICLIIIGLVVTGRAGYVIEFMGGVRGSETPVRTMVDQTVAALFCFAFPGAALGLLVWGNAQSSPYAQLDPVEPSEAVGPRPVPIDGNPVSSPALVIKSPDRDAPTQAERDSNYRHFDDRES